MKARRLRAVIASFAFFAWTFGALTIAGSAVADDGPLSEALGAYAGGNNEEGLAKLRAYVESNPSPEDILAALRGADDHLLGRILTLRGEHEKLLKYLLVKARPVVEAREEDPTAIQGLVDAAVKGESLEARRTAAMKLRALGELAVPALYPYLGSEEPETVVSAMLAFRYLGEDATLALAETVHSDDARLRGYVAEVLGEIGDRRARGHLLQLLERDQDATVKQKAQQALAQLGGGAPGGASEAFVALGLRVYSRDPSLVSGFDATKNLWRWEDGKLVRYAVPAYLWPYQVAEDAATHALELQPANAAARALLVRALLAQKVEADVLKAGGLEPPAVILERAFDLAASQGFRAASDALAQALAAEDWDVAVELCALVAKTFSGEPLQGHPLGNALVAKEKRVRYAGAIAALHMSPPRGLPNVEKVTALAAQAASEEALRQVLVIDDREGTRARLVMDLAHAGYVVAAEPSGTEGVSRAKQAPTMDVILVRGDLGDPTRRTELDRYSSSILVIDELLQDARTKDMRVVVLLPEGPAEVVEAHKTFFTNKYTDKLKGFVTVPIDTAAMIEVVNAAAAAGDLSPDEARANRLAAVAAEAFATTDFSCTLLNLADAVEPLSAAATGGPTPEVRLAAVRGLGNIRAGGADALVKVLKEGENDDLKAAAAAALGNVLANVKPGPGHLEALIEASKVEGPVGQSALRALGNVRAVDPAVRLQIFHEHRLPVGTKPTE